MPNFPYYSTAAYLTATGTVVISTSNAKVQGILFHGTGTGKLMIFAGVTSTVTSSAIPLSGNIVAYGSVAGQTANQSIYMEFPAFCSGGLTVVVAPSLDPKITLFWSPE